MDFFRFLSVFGLVLCVSSCASAAQTTKPLQNTSRPTSTSFPTVLPTQTVSPSPTQTSTPTPTISATPTITKTPVPSPTPTYTVEPTPTFNPAFEVIKEFVGNRPEDWFQWKSAEEWMQANGYELPSYEVKIIYPGVSSFNAGTLELKNGEGEIVGTASSWFTGQYLIGNRLQEVIVPIYWETAEGFCFCISQQYNCSLLLPIDLTEISITRRWKPGQVIHLYIAKPDKTKLAFIYDEWTPAMSDIWKGRTSAFDNFIESGESPGILLPNLYRRKCINKPDEVKYPFFCDLDTVIIPGFQ